MTYYDFGDVVLVPFPFTDQTTSKKRPAVVVSSPVYNRERPDLVIMAITSQIKASAHFGDVPIIQWKEAGLIKPSIIKSVFTTVEKKLVYSKLGRLIKKKIVTLFRMSFKGFSVNKNKKSGRSSSAPLN